MAPYQNYQTQTYENLRQLYHASARQYGEKPFLLLRGKDAYEEISFQRFSDEVDALGSALMADGMTDKPILILGDDGYEWALSYVAVLCMGVAVPIDRKRPTEQIAAIAKHCDAAAVICDESHEEAVRQSMPTLPCYTFSKLASLIEQGERLLRKGDRSYLDHPISPTQMHAILYTSGTTSHPKGVMLSHRNLCFNLSQMCQMIRIDRNDVFLSVLPLHHVYQSTCGFLCPLFRGASVAFAGGIQRFQLGLREIHPTVLLCTPLLLETLYEKIRATVINRGVEEKVVSLINSTNAIPNAKLRMATKRKLFADIHNSFGGRLRLLISGGEPVDPKALAGMRNFGFLALQGYGLTECAPIVTLNRDTHYNDRSVGMASPNTFLDVWSVENEDVGEIRFRGDNVMLGYYKMPALTEKVLRDGWFYTGDLGYLDSNGFLYVIGRKDNVIRSKSGERVYPEELESLLKTHEIIKEAVVVGYSTPSQQGADVVAIIHPDHTKIKGKTKSLPPSAQIDLEIRKAISATNGQVSAGKRISAYLIRSEAFPKKSSQKICRDGIADLYREAYLEKLQSQRKPKG